MKTCQCGLTNDFKYQSVEVTDAIEPKTPPTFCSKRKRLMKWGCSMWLQCYWKPNPVFCLLHDGQMDNHVYVRLLCMLLSVFC